MKISQMFPTKFARADELDGKAVTLTIERIITESVRREKWQETVYVLRFKGAGKGVILSSRLAHEIAEAIGSDDTDNWIGKPIVLFPTQVDAFGKRFLVFGARKASPAQTTAQAAEPTTAAFADEDATEIPY